MGERLDEMLGEKLVKWSINMLGMRLVERLVNIWVMGESLEDRLVERLGEKLVEWSINMLGMRPVERLGEYL